MSFAYRFRLLALVTALAGFASLQARAQEAAEEAPEGIRIPEAQAAYDSGKQLLAEGKFKEAVGKFNEATTIDQGFADAFILKGDAMHAAKDFEGAFQSYSRAISIDGSLGPAYAGRGEVALELRNIDLASADLARALELDPNNPKVLSSLGHLMINYLGDATGALKKLDDALALNPQDARAYRDRGWAHAQLREFTEAMADLQKAVETDPNDYENYERLASIALFQEQYQPAIDALTKAIEVYKPKQRTDPAQFITGYILRADAHMRIGEKETDPARRTAEFEAAVADADAVLGIYPDRFPESGLALYRRGRALRMLERYAEAIKALTSAIQNVPPGQDVAYLSEAYMFRGICWYYTGSYQLARGDFEQAGSIGNGYQDPRVDLWVGLTHHKESDFREAIDAYSKAVAKDPSFAIAYVNRGRAYADLKEWRRAIENFNDAIRVEPSDAEHYYSTGRAYLRLEEFEQAASFLELALLQENARPQMNRAMAEAMRGLGRDELAAEYERKAETKSETPASGG
jgi:tetratricopeptide (TPR) repeat protein